MTRPVCHTAHHGSSVAAGPRHVRCLDPGAPFLELSALAADGMVVVMLANAAEHDVDTTAGNLWRAAST